VVFDMPTGYGVSEADGALMVCLDATIAQVQSEFQATLTFNELSAIGTVLGRGAREAGVSSPPPPLSLMQHLPMVQLELVYTYCLRLKAK
jgi:hypothetical protein